MLSNEENQMLTRVDLGTPMGDLMRRYWIPAGLSTEIESDGEPVRVRLLGERLVMFRDTDGQVGLLSEQCPHRGASLWFGRNEERGLRCVYHGWKFDRQGRCLEMMNEPTNSDFSSKIQNIAYPIVESGGLVWAYLGPANLRPCLPRFAWTQVAEHQRHVNKTLQECNWLQGLEGGLDTSHAPILHRRFDDASDQPGVSMATPFAMGNPPRIEVDATDYGYAYYGIRDLSEGRIHVRGYHFVMPFTQIRQEPFSGDDIVAGHMWVPIDDSSCMVYNWEYSPSARGMDDQEAVARILGTGPGEQTSDFRKVRNRGNDYLIDRDVQRFSTFTGIFGVNTQDHAVQESMGPTVDRSLEHLGPADKAIISMRRQLFAAMRTVVDGGNPAGTGDSYYGAVAVDCVLDNPHDFRVQLRSGMYSDTEPPTQAGIH